MKTLREFKGKKGKKKKEKRKDFDGFPSIKVKTTLFIYLKAH